MSMVVASYTPVSRSPVTQTSSSTRRVSHSQSWRPPPPPFFPASAAVKCSRPTLPVARSVGPPEKHRPVFNIPPTALLYHVPPPEGKERWEIKDDEDNVQLWLQVPGLTEDDIEITTTEDLLEIKRKVDVQGVGSFHLWLLLTKEFVSSQVTAKLKAGMLEVTIPKNKNLRRNIVTIGQQSQTPAPVTSLKDPPPTSLPPSNNLARGSGALLKDPPPASLPPSNNLVRGLTAPLKDPPPASLPPSNNIVRGSTALLKDPPPASLPPSNNLVRGSTAPLKDPPPARRTSVQPKDPPPASQPSSNNLVRGASVQPKDPPPTSLTPNSTPRNPNEPLKNPPVPPKAT